MKNKKLIPFIMGCAMLAAVSSPAHAEINGQDENEFTQYNTSSMGTTGKIFTTDEATITNGIGNGTVDLTDSITSREDTTIKYGTKGYTKGNTNSGEETENVDPDSITNLWTTISSYTLNVPAKTVIPLGASKWNIGQVEIVNGKAFLNPDKVKVDIKSTPLYLNGTTQTGADAASKTINYDIRLNAGDAIDGIVSDSSLIDNTKSTEEQKLAPTVKKHIYFYYKGTRGATFPYTYTDFDTKNIYDNNQISEVNQGQHVWVNCNDWKNKVSGQYQGKITFTASIESMPTDEIATNNGVSAYSGT